MRACLVLCVLTACGTAPTTATPPPPTTATSSTTPPPPTTATPPPSTTAPPPTTAPDPDTLLAAHASVAPTLDGDLSDPAWAAASPIEITTDYAGAAIASPTTTVRILWTSDALFIAFDASFDPPLTAPDAPPSEYEHLYGYDVVEAFLDADPSTPHSYREIELGPRGHTLDVAVDLDARPHGDVAWSSGTEHAERVDEDAHRFTIEARIPASALELAALTPSDLRIGLFRITSHTPSPRLFLARFPTLTPRPNFHVPERFGILHLAE